jgi:ATP-binding cassette subfamily B protein
MKKGKPTSQPVSAASEGFRPSYLWLLRAAKPYRNYAIYTVICGLIITLSEMAAPKFLQIIIDDLLPSRSMYAMYGMIGVIVVIFLLTYMARKLRTSWQIRFSEYVFRDIQMAAIQHIRRLGIPYFEKNAVGDSLSLMNADLPRIQGLLRFSLPLLLQDLMLAVVSLIFMMSINVKLILCVIPAFVVYCLVGPLLSKQMLFYNRRLHQQRALRDQKAYESISALPELRVNDAYQWDAGRYGTLMSEMHRRWTIQQLWVRIRSMSAEFFYYVGAIFVFIFGAKMIQDGSLGIGAFVAFMFYFLFFIQTVARFFLSWADVEISMQQVRRVYELLQEEPLVKEAANPLPLPKTVDIEVDHVYFGYTDGASILRDISLHIPSGFKVALVGPTGNGKTTLLKMLVRFYDPDAGDIRIGGISLKQLSLERLHQSVGYIFQESFMFGRTVKENIRLGHATATDEQVEFAAIQAVIHEEIMQMPQGYDTLVGERGVKLSGGQKQRVAIARLFLKNPQIVLLDEAMSALDSLHESKVQEAFHRLYANRTVISVVHRISTLQQEYDLIVVLDNGCVSEQGTYEELIRRKGLFYRLLTGNSDEQGESHDEY